MGTCDRCGASLVDESEESDKVMCHNGVLHLETKCYNIKQEMKLEKVYHSYNLCPVCKFAFYAWVKREC